MSQSPVGDGFNNGKVALHIAKEVEEILSSGGNSLKAWPHQHHVWEIEIAAKK